MITTLAKSSMLTLALLAVPVADKTALTRTSFELVSAESEHNGKPVMQVNSEASHLGRPVMQASADSEHNGTPVMLVRIVKWKTITAPNVT